MRLILSSTLCVMACAAVVASAQPAAGTTTNLAEKGSYALGANLGNNLRAQDAVPNLDQLLQGLKDGLNNKVTLNEQDLRDNYMAWQREIRNAKMEKNKKIGDEFLAKKAQEPGVKKFPDGLMYKVVTSGKGPQPKPEDRVSAHYRGTLIDGTEFDSSYTRGKPLVSPVRGLIPGWQEALTNMHVGDKWELYIPPQLGYGERGSGAKIGPNATLVFEMELLSIEPPQTNAPAGGAPTINLTPGGGSSRPIQIQPNTGNASQPIRVQPAQPAK